MTFGMASQRTDRVIGPELPTAQATLSPKPEPGPRRPGVARFVFYAVLSQVSSHRHPTHANQGPCRVLRTFGGEGVEGAGGLWAWVSVCVCRLCCSCSSCRLMMTPRMVLAVLVMMGSTRTKRKRKTAAAAAGCFSLYPAVVSRAQA